MNEAIGILSEVIAQAVKLLALGAGLAAFFGALYVIGRGAYGLMAGRKISLLNLLTMFLAVIIILAAIVYIPRAVVLAVAKSWNETMPEIWALTDAITGDVETRYGGGGFPPTAVPPPVTLEPTAAPVSATAVPALPTVQPAFTPAPTVTAVPTLDLTIWNVQTPPPTPIIAR